MAQKTGIEIVAATFTNHLAVVLRISTPNYEVVRQRLRWKTDPVAMQDENLKVKIRDAMVKWRPRQCYYSDIVQWWERCVKTQLQRLIRCEDTERHKDYTLMENHLYGCLYNILRSNIPESNKLPAMQ